MTRENKLALVVGFGLILLVGILVSDHFSEARNQEPAELSPTVDPLSATRADNPELIALRTHAPERSEPAAGAVGLGAGKPPARSGDAARPYTRAVDPVVPESTSASVEMGGGRPFGVGLPEAEAEQLPYTFHHVRSGEYLSTICKNHYGDASLADALAKYNGLSDPNAIQLGQRLRMPPANDLVRGRTAPPKPPATPTGDAAPPDDRATAGHSTYTVQDGEVLSEIASKLLGSARKYNLIYEANRDVLKSPDDIRAGMKLRIPR